MDNALATRNQYSQKAYAQSEGTDPQQSPKILFIHPAQRPKMIVIKTARISATK